VQYAVRVEDSVGLTKPCHLLN